MNILISVLVLSSWTVGTLGFVTYGRGEESSSGQAVFSQHYQTFFIKPKMFSCYYCSYNTGSSSAHYRQKLQWQLS